MESLNKAFISIETTGLNSSNDKDLNHNNYVYVLISSLVICETKCFLGAESHPA